MRYAVRICGLKKSYGDHVVLKGLDFDIEEGEILALLGTNGAGKTTTLECVEGLKAYEGGSVTVNGKTGIQLQSASLPAGIRPMEAVRLFAKWNRTEIDDVMLAELGIQGMGKKEYKQLSTGQKRRLHLALALAGDPDIVFLDEPTAGLDVEGRQALHSQIRKLKARGKTIILASHDMAEVDALCDRIAILKEGKIVFCGTPEELTNQIRAQFTVYIRTEQGEEIHTTEDVAGSLLTVLGELRERGVRVLDIRVDRGSLEEHFMEIAGRAGK